MGRIRFARLAVLLLLGACSSENNSLEEPQGGVSDEEFITIGVISGEWVLAHDVSEDTGACTQSFPGEPGTYFEMLQDYRATGGSGPFPVRMEVKGVGLVYLSCTMGASTALEEAEMGSFLCNGELPEPFYPNPDVDAAWSVSVRIEGILDMWVPCNLPEGSQVFDYAGFDTTWSLTLAGECIGLDCEEELPPQGLDGEPLCIQSFALDGMWTGCGAEGTDSECRQLIRVENEYGSSGYVPESNCEVSSTPTSVSTDPTPSTPTPAEPTPTPLPQ